MDKSIMAEIECLPEEEKLKMSTVIDQLQIRDSLRMYNTLVERCFSECIDSFWRKSLTKQEGICVRRCAEKFLGHSTRVGFRFADVNQGSDSI